MAINSTWFYWASTSADSGFGSNSVTLNIGPEPLYAIAALNEYSSNSSGGTASATIESYETRNPATGVDSAPILVNGPMFSNANVVSITFLISVYANPAGSFFSSGVTAKGTFLTQAWDG